MVSGHVTPEVPTVPFRIARANGGQWVYQLLFDFQWEKPYDGNGWIGLLTFHPDEMLEVRLYSPLLDEWGEYRDPQGFTSRMWIDLRQGRVIDHDAHDHDAQDAGEAAGVIGDTHVAASARRPLRPCAVQPVSRVTHTYSLACQ